MIQMNNKNKIKMLDAELVKSLFVEKLKDTLSTRAVTVR